MRVLESAHKECQWPKTQPDPQLFAIVRRFLLSFPHSLCLWALHLFLLLLPPSVSSASILLSLCDEDQQQEQIRLLPEISHSFLFFFFCCISPWRTRKVVCVFQDTSNRICGVLTAASLSKALARRLRCHPDCPHASLAFCLSLNCLLHYLLQCVVMSRHSMIVLSRAFVLWLYLPSLSLSAWCRHWSLASASEKMIRAMIKER